jgi:transposase
MEAASSLRAEFGAISSSDWESTPASVRQFLLRLLERVEQQGEQIAALQLENSELRTKVSALEAENATLREQVKRNSGNSSQPPSQDIAPGVVVKRKRPSGGRRGGQPGHAGHERFLYDVADCIEVVEHYPAHCGVCGGGLSGSDPAPDRHQVVEIPPVMPEVVEHRFHALICPHCEATTRASSSAIVAAGGYGPRLSGLVVLLSAQAHQSHGQVLCLLAELFGVVISTGMVARLRQQFNQVVRPAVAAALRYVQQQAAVNMDETSFRQGNCDGQNATASKAWLWVITTALVSHFHMSLSRGQVITTMLLGADYPGIVGSDRAGAYNHLPLAQRQICWAHLKRDFTAMAERGGISAEIGHALLDIEQDVFNIWYDFRLGIIGRAGLREQLAPCRYDLKQLLRQTISRGTKGQTPLAKTARTCVQILKLEPALWTFVEHPGVEPTNNAAERAVRPAVLWRRASFGVQSQTGAEFVANALTVITSLRAQQRSVLDYLTDLFEAARRGLQIPSLLPST